MIKRTLLFLVLLISGNISAQQTVSEDDYARFLLPEDPNRYLYQSYRYQYNNAFEKRRAGANLDRFEIIYTDPPSNGFINFPWIISSDALWISWELPKNFCGERFYKNGNIQSRCECTEDSVRHGKSVFWDQNGALSSISYHFNGHLTSNTSYSNGKIRSKNYYKIFGNKSLQHGKQYEYIDNTTTVYNYVRGKKEGIESVYINGKISRESLFDNERETRIYLFNTEGDTIAKRFYTFHETNPHIKIPIGTWTEFNPNDSTWSYITFQNGAAHEIVTKKNGLDREYHLVRTNGKKSHFFYDETGKMTSEFYTKPYEFYYPSVNPGYGDYMPMNPPYIRKQFVDWGYISSDTCTIFYDSRQSTRSHPYLICHKMQGKDTLELFYAMNDGDYFESVLQRNKFIRTENGYRRQGKWLHYDNNKLVSVTEYEKGNLNGAFILYDTSGVEPRPIRTGHYSDNLKNGEWTCAEDSLIDIKQYSAGKLNGTFIRAKRKMDTTQVTANQYNGANRPTTHPQHFRTITEQRDTLFSVNYQNDSLTGEVITYWRNGKIHWKGFFENGIPTGEWIEFPETGDTPIQYGTFSDGNPENDWRYLFIKKNGKEVYRKLKEEPELPMPIL